MQTSKRLKIYCALLLFVTIVASAVASVGTSYARFVYTGEHQTIFYEGEGPEIDSNVMFPQGCTVVLKDWDLNNTYDAQTITASFSGKEAKGRITCSIPQEYAEYYTVVVTDANDAVITENDEVSVDASGTEVKITVTPVDDKLVTLTAAVSAEALLKFTELTETTAEDGTVTVSEGNTMTGTLKWNIIPLDVPVPAKPQIPTATVTEIVNEELTFALNFKADEVTDAQLEYYGSWYADFELKINKDVTFNADGSADGWLSGQYDAWSENWVNVPFENVTLAANTPLKIMEYAAELMGQPGLKYTYAEVYEGVKEFNCGVFFDKEYLAANPDLEVTLELRMYNPADESESYVIGETYTFTIEPPDIPTATATVIEKEDLTFALNFKADEATEEQLEYYGAWPTDFEITLNKGITFHANDSSADGWMSGQLDAWNENWVKIPLTGITLSAGQSFKIMEYASVLLDKPDYSYTYAEVYEGIRDFDCGVFFSEQYLAANPDLEVQLELKMYNPDDAAESYVIGQTYTFAAKDLDTAAGEQDTEQSEEAAAACEICNSENHTTENHTEETTAACESCGSTEHTTENCDTDTGTAETETTETDENSDNNVSDVTAETETMAYSAAYAVTGMQLKSAAVNTKTENITVIPMLFTGQSILATVADTTESSSTPSVAADYTGTSSGTASASNVSVTHGTDVVTYTYITYPVGTKTIEIADFENVAEGEGIRYINSFIPYFQVYTEEMIYVFPFDTSLVIETDPLVAGTFSFKIVAPGAYTVSEETDETEEETETAAAEEKIYTSKAVQWKLNDGTTVLKTSENICYAVDGSDFDNTAPLTSILSATGPIKLKTIPVKSGNPVCTIEYYSGGAYTPADAEDFSVEFDKETNTLTINRGEHYPQAGIYRVCQQLQTDNGLSVYYKTFFVNYR